MPTNSIRTTSTRRGRSGARDVLLDVAQLAGMPFSVRWFFLANSQLRESRGGYVWSGAGTASAAPRLKTERTTTASESPSRFR